MYWFTCVRRACTKRLSRLTGLLLIMFGVAPVIIEFDTISTFFSAIVVKLIKFYVPNATKLFITLVAIHTRKMSHFLACFWLLSLTSFCSNFF